GHRIEAVAGARLARGRPAHAGAPAAGPRDGAGRPRGRIQRGRVDLVGVGEGGLVARDRADADALLDRKAARLDDALVEAPALAAGVLEVEVRVIDAVLQDRAERPPEMRFVEPVRLQQRAP